MKPLNKIHIAVLFFCIWNCVLAQQPAASPSATPIGPPDRKQGYLLSIHDRVAEQSRRIRIAEKSGALSKEQASSLRLKLRNFTNQANMDIKKGEKEPSAAIQKSRWDQLTAIAREIDAEIKIAPVTK